METTTVMKSVVQPEPVSIGTPHQVQSNQFMASSSSSSGFLSQLSAKTGMAITSTKEASADAFQEILEINSLASKQKLKVFFRDSRFDKWEMVDFTEELEFKKFQGKLTIRDGKLFIHFDGESYARELFFDTEHRFMVKYKSANYKTKVWRAIFCPFYCCNPRFHGFGKIWVKVTTY
eukprot:c22034_g9_i1.p1 GENE.c22034_g9_i1~~c22034_g9_i1.p1  ORF type:complete len:177 (+),score=39.92 c22034_g9_i1:41-571(+)